MVAAAGYIAAVAAGASPDAMLPGYAAELQRRVLTPMGLRDTTLSLLQVRAAGTGATPHGLALDNTFEPLPLAEEHLLMPVAPAGALWSTGPDMARYVLTLLAGGVTPEGRRIVSQDGLGTLFEPQTQINANVRYALGWMVSDWKGLRLIQHDGNTFGFTASVAMLPEQDLGVVVLANARGANVFASAVASRVLEDAFGLDTSDSNASFRFALDYTRNNVSEYLDRMQDDLDLPALRPFLGRFHNGALGDITVTLDGGRLWLDVGEFRQELRRHLDKDGQSRYVAFDPPLAGLTLAPAGDPGEPGWTLIWQPEDYRFTRR
jgi:CubicO group peptidase (beta-lactamase class C family)